MQHMFHGSCTTGLTVIEPQRSPYGISPVYGTEDSLKALVFARHDGIGDDYFNINFNTTHPVVLTERVEGVFDRYFDKPGSVYTLNNQAFVQSAIYPFEHTSDVAQQVLNEKTYPSVLNALQDKSSTGEVKLYYYPDRPDTIPHDDSDLVKMYIDWGREDIESGQGITEIIKMVEELHPKLLSQVQFTLNSLDRVNGQNAF